MMPLFKVLDPSRPMYVIEKTFSTALALYMEVVTAGNETLPDEIEPPREIIYICDDDELLVRLPVSCNILIGKN
jgi:hypothetical protein